MASPIANSLNHQPAASALSRALVLTYGLLTYALFLATFLYMIGFISGFGVPKTMNDGVTGSGWSGVVINALLLGLFAIQHTIMARPAFKRWLSRFIPAAAERSTFVLATCILLLLLVWQWRPFPDGVWHFEGVAAGALWVVAAIGWAVVLISTFLIDHFELFGLKQTLGHALGRRLAPAQFVERLFYRWVRHPLMLGFLLAFWATPHMTRGHLLFAGLATGYILLALIIEERTLVELHGKAYQDYQRRVPKLIPGRGRRS